MEKENAPGGVQYSTIVPLVEIANDKIILDGKELYTVLEYELKKTVDKGTELSIRLAVRV